MRAQETIAKYKGPFRISERTDRHDCAVDDDCPRAYPALLHDSHKTVDTAKTGLGRVVRKQRKTLGHFWLPRLTFVFIELKVEIPLRVRNPFQRFQGHREQAITKGAHPNGRDRTKPLDHFEATPRHR